MMDTAMKYVIGGILGFMLGAGVEMERNKYTPVGAYAQFGVAYGCGEVAGTKNAIKVFKPENEQRPELPQCSDYRMLWEAVR
jgi:hypothetical protein